MLFEREVPLPPRVVLDMLGYGGTPPDAQTAALLEEAIAITREAAEPRWTSAAFPLTDAPFGLDGLALPGADIRQHLEGCKDCLLLGLTLGSGVERAIRAAEASDMALAVLLDAAASALAELYAEEAEALLREKAQRGGSYLTSRFSPGYGDLPLSLQGGLLRLLDGGRAIGLTTAGGLLLPRKSVTALLGLSKSPVRGRLAGCGGCAQHTKCEGRALCGKAT